MLFYVNIQRGDGVGSATKVAAGGLPKSCRKRSSPKKIRRVRFGCDGQMRACSVAPITLSAAEKLATRPDGAVQRALEHVGSPRKAVSLVAGQDARGWV